MDIFSNLQNLKDAEITKLRSLIFTVYMKLQKQYQLWFLMAILILVTASGCTTAPLVVNDPGKVEAKINLKPGEFKVVGAVKGEASCPYLFWIDIYSPERTKPSPVPLFAIELGNPHLLELAMQDLYSKHDLQGKPQILHNVIEEWSVANYLGLFAIRKVSFMAEIIEFTGPGEVK